MRVENGQLGLEVIQKENPDVILLDLMMPVMDGVTMLHKLRELVSFKETKVIVLTNAGDVENMRQTMTMDNAIEFLIKSNVSLDQIAAKVKTLLP